VQAEHKPAGRACRVGKNIQCCERENDFKSFLGSSSQQHRLLFIINRVFCQWGPAWLMHLTAVKQRNLYKLCLLVRLIYAGLWVWVTHCVSTSPVSRSRNRLKSTDTADCVSAKNTNHIWRTLLVQPPGTTGAGTYSADTAKAVPLFQVVRPALSVKCRTTF